MRPEYNSNNMKVDTSIKKRLEEAGMDSLLASHYANILSRDPIALTKDEVKSYQDIDLFEILHSAVWPHVDFKLPSKDGKAGWRVEFRPLEIQLSDFDNAAFAIFVVLCSRAILHFDLNLYIPISKVSENMDRAQTRDAVHAEEFYFRRHVQTKEHASTAEGKDEYALMTVDEIVNGKIGSPQGVSFVGLIPTIQSYMHETGTSPEEEKRINEYLEVVRRRANGELLTPATWMRQFVRSHNDYHQDSIVSQTVCYDLLKVVKDLGDGKVHSVEVLRNREEPNGAPTTVKN